MTDDANFDIPDGTRATGGERFAPAELAELAATPDILSLGMLADGVRRRLHDTQVTYVRVATCALDEPFAEAVPPVAREVRHHRRAGLARGRGDGCQQAKAVAGDRAVSGFSWSVIEARSKNAAPCRAVLDELRNAGLDALARLPLDELPNRPVAIERSLPLDSIVSADDRQGARRRTRDTLRARRRPAGARDVHPGDQSTADGAQRVPSDHRLRRCEDGGDCEARSTRYPTVQVDWTRYGPEAGAGRAHVRRRRSRRRRPVGRCARRPAACAARRRSTQYRGGGFDATERDGRFAVRRLNEAGAARRGRVPECPAAHVGARPVAANAGTSATTCRRRARRSCMPATSTSG